MKPWTEQAKEYRDKAEGMTPEEKSAFWWKAYQNGEISKRAYEWLEMWND